MAKGGSQRIARGDCVKMLRRYKPTGQARGVGKVVNVIGGDLLMVQYGGYGGRFQSYDASIFKKVTCPRGLDVTYGSELRQRKTRLERW